MTGKFSDLDLIVLNLGTAQKALVKLGCDLDSQANYADVLFFLAQHLDHVCRDLDDWQAAAIEAARAADIETTNDYNGQKLVH